MAVKTYGKEMAERISARMTQVSAADSVEMLIQYDLGRCHPLKRNRKNEFAMDLVHPFRLVFEKRGHEFELVKIISIEDYH